MSVLFVLIMSELLVLSRCLLKLFIISPYIAIKSTVPLPRSLDEFYFCAL